MKWDTWAAERSAEFKAVAQFSNDAEKLLHYFHRERSREQSPDFVTEKLVKFGVEQSRAVKFVQRLLEVEWLEDVNV